MRANARRQVAAGLPRRLPLRSMPTLDGLPVPSHARRRQPAPRALTSHVPNDGQGFHSYAYVVFHLPLGSCYETGTPSFQTDYVSIFTSVRSHVLARGAWERHGHGTPRRPRRGRRGHGERDTPATSFPVLLAQARESRALAWEATSPSRNCVLKNANCRLFLSCGCSPEWTSLSSIHTLISVHLPFHRFHRFIFMYALSYSLE